MPVEASDHSHAPGSHGRPVASRSRREGGGPMRLFGFLALVVAACYGLDAAISLGLRKIPTSKFGALNRIFSGQANAAIVINGSSRALNHYDPRGIEKATGQKTQNLGMNASQVDVQLAILKSYLKHNTKPKIVIQNLDVFSFETTRRGEIYDPAAYVPYLGEDELYYPLVKIDPGVRKWKYIPLYGYAVEDMTFTWAWGLLGIVGVYGGENYVQGFNPRFMEWTGDFSKFKASAENGVTYRIETEGVNAMRQIIKTCHEQGIELIFVYSPEYYEMQSLVKNRQEIFAGFQRLATEHGVPLWDYSESPITRNRDNFYNSQHLNATGAWTFSEDLGRKLKNHLQSRAANSADRRE